MGEYEKSKSLKDRMVKNNELKAMVGETIKLVKFIADDFETTPEIVLKAINKHFESITPPPRARRIDRWKKKR